METAMSAKIVTTLLLNLALFSPCLSTAFTPNKFGSMPIRHDYTRFADVERHCQSVLSAAADAELKDDVDRGSRVMYQLSFMNGDWSQDAGQAPLLPFDGSYADPAVAAGPDELLEAVPLASFRLTHVETAPRRGRGARAAFNVSGFLDLSIARNRSCSWFHTEMEPNPSPEFELRPGIATLHLVFQGVYTETRSSPGSGGERVLCMVGDALLPVRGSNSTDPWQWAKNDGSGGGGGNMELEPPVLSDGNILLVLRYPKTPTLTNRVVHGVMRSTNAKSGGAYFDTIRLVSQLSVGGYGSDYQFRREDDAELSDVVAWCGKDDDSPFHEGDAMEQHLNSGDSPNPCGFVHKFNYNSQLMEVVPNWNCNGTDEFCSQLGPFVSWPPATSRALEDMPFARPAPAIAVTMGCRPLGTGSMDGRAAAAVAAVFRYVPPWEHHPTAATRTGMSGMTLSAEGVWIPSMGRVCMVGCLGVGVANEACGYRVSLSVRTTMSLTRRGIIAGEITAKDGRSHPPLLFQQRLDQHHPLQRHVSSYLYTKVERARELLLRLRAIQPWGLRNSFVARSLLSYPSIAAGVAANDEMVGLANLVDDLDLRFQLTVKPAFVPQWIEVPFFQLQILSIGTMVGRDRYGEYLAQSPRIEPVSRVHGVEQLHILYHQKKKQHKLLNVSAEFMASRNCLHPSPVMSMEGVYNPEDGRMYLIGCRSVHAPRRLLPMIRDLEDGMDCSIEVTVEYPPTTTRWLISREAKVFIASTRDEDDPLHFNRSELHSRPVIYRDQRMYERTEPIVEGLLCITMLSAAIVATIRQLCYIKSHADVAPYISLAMLAVQALGYIVTLVTDAKMLPAWPSQSQRYGQPYDYHMGWNILECSVKALTLVALAVTARLAQKVWRSRARARARAPLEPDRVPGDTMVLLYSFVVHLGTLFFVVAVHSPPPMVFHYQQQGTSSWSWHMCTRCAVMERYVSVMKEWFLLPQVIGNAVWRVNCKPLAAGYYVGVTAVWLLPHIYGYLRPPVVNMYSPDAHAPVMGYYKDGSTVVIPLVGVMLALVVFVQQRWNYKIIGWAMKTERIKLQHAY